MIANKMQIHQIDKRNRYTINGVSRKLENGSEVDARSTLELRYT